MNPNFEVTSEASERGTHAVRLVAKGELDTYVEPVIVDRVTELASQGIKLIILDLGGVTFLDSSGLRAIIKAGNLLAARDGQLLIEGASGATQRVLEITGMLERYRSADMSDDPVC
ncbi:MAG: STAS domain-containing protein [Acidimicrobiales bacterium]